MAFNPELGSTSPAVLLDNAERLDKLVNGPELTEPDRAGVELDTWRGMMAKNDQVTEDARKSITALGLPYSTLSEAQAAVNNGQIPVDSVCYVRSTDDAVAIEYLNEAGTLVPTGNVLPSEETIDKKLNQRLVPGQYLSTWFPVSIETEMFTRGLMVDVGTLLILALMHEQSLNQYLTPGHKNFSPRETTLQITFRLFTTEMEMFMHGSITVCMTVMDLGQILKNIS